MPTNPDPPGYDTLGWPRDVLAVWIEADVLARAAVREALPELGRALDRQADEVMTPGPKRARRLRAPGQPARPVPWEDNRPDGGRLTASRQRTTDRVNESCVKCRRPNNMANLDYCTDCVCLSCGLGHRTKRGYEQCDGTPGRIP